MRTINDIDNSFGQGPTGERHASSDVMAAARQTIQKLNSENPLNQDISENAMIILHDLNQFLTTTSDSEAGRQELTAVVDKFIEDITRIQHEIDDILQQIRANDEMYMSKLLFGLFSVERDNVAGPAILRDNMVLLYLRKYLSDMKIAIRFSDESLLEMESNLEMFTSLLKSYTHLINSSSAIRDFSETKTEEL